jgi:ribosomal protein S4E
MKVRVTTQRTDTYDTHYTVEIPDGTPDPDSYIHEHYESSGDNLVHIATGTELESKGKAVHITGDGGIESVEIIETEEE